LRQIIETQSSSAKIILPKVATMPLRSLGGFDPEQIAEMTKILDDACKELQGTGEPDVVRERIAMRIMAAAKVGERDPVRLLEAALRQSE
jgi:hypothetical protein